jgi:nucleoside-diphosphate-sugar epimerase
MTTLPRAEPVAFSARIAGGLRASGLRVLITGASGWMGRATLEALEQALGPDFDSRVLAFGSRARPLALRSGRRIEVAELGALRELPRAPSLLLHYAFLTKDRVAGLSAQEYFGASEALTQSVAQAMPRIGVERLLFPSSGAVYGQPMRQDYSVLEEPEKNPYGTQKLRDEQGFTRLCREHGVRLAIPRVFSLSGPFINKHEAYVLASIINRALEHAPVELRARRAVFRSYIGVRDLLDVAFGWLMAEPAEQVIFDTGGEIVEVGELARRILSVLDCTDLAISRPTPDGSPEDRMVGRDTGFNALAAAAGIVVAPLDRQIADTAAYLAEDRA